MMNCLEPNVGRCWDIKIQVSEQKLPITDGRIIINGKNIKRGERKRPDFVLSYCKNFPLAVIEVKDNKAGQEWDWQL